MKNFVLLFLVLSFFNGFSQKKHEDGEFKGYYKDGEVKTVGFYRNNKKIGIWKEYFKNGQLSRVFTYDNSGNYTYIEESYNKEGNLIRERKQVQNGGFVQKHYHHNGNLSIIYAQVPSNNNKGLIKSGGYKGFFEDGTLKIECEYINNQLSGVCKEYYETGEKEWEVEFLNDYRQGYYKQYYKNGQIKVEGTNLANLKNGAEKRYDEQGNLIWEGTYLKDDFNGYWYQYDASGKQINILKFKEGKLKKSDNPIELTATGLPDGLDSVEVPFALIENVPVYPGCQKQLGNSNKKNCMSKGIAEFFSRNFNTRVCNGLDLSGIQRINVIFKIDKLGNVTGAMAKAEHSDLEREALRVVNLLPKMQPGLQFGKPVTVPYSLPIVFKIQEKSINNNTNSNSNSNKFKSNIIKFQ